MPVDVRLLTELLYEDFLVAVSDEGLPDDFELDLRKLMPHPERVSAHINSVFTVAEIRRRIRNERGAA